MAEDHIVISSGRSLTYDEVAARTFTSSFRGFDQAEVRLFLKRIGDELLVLADNERQLRQSLDEARERAAHPELDENALTAALGEQTTRVLQSAREAAIDIRDKAEENAVRGRRGGSRGGGGRGSSHRGGGARALGERHGDRAGHPRGRDAGRSRRLRRRGGAALQGPAHPQPARPGERGRRWGRARGGAAAVRRRRRSRAR